MTCLEGLLARVQTHCAMRGDCWIWGGPVDSNGVGQPEMQWGGSRVRVRKELMRIFGTFGDDSMGSLVTVATCGTHRCVRPEHLKALTMSEYVSMTKVENGRKISASLKRYNAWKPLASKKKARRRA